MTMPKRCGECGSRSIKLNNVRGKRFPYHSFPAVELLTDLELYTCLQCNNIIYGPKDAKRLDEAIEKSIQIKSKQFIEIILQKTNWSQAEMADILGFSKVYISEIKNFKKVLEYKTYSYLKVLSCCEDALECVCRDDPRVEFSLKHDSSKKDKNIKLAK